MSAMAAVLSPIENYGWRPTRKGNQSDWLAGRGKPLPGGFPYAQNERLNGIAATFSGLD